MREEESSGAPQNQSPGPSTSRTSNNGSPSPPLPAQPSTSMGASSFNAASMSSSSSSSFSSSPPTSASSRSLSATLTANVSVVESGSSPSSRAGLASASCGNLSSNSIGSSSAAASSGSCSGSTPAAANLNRASAPSNLSGSSASLASSLHGSVAAGGSGSLSSSAIGIVPSSRPSGCGPSSSSGGAGGPTAAVGYSAPVAAAAAAAAGPTSSGSPVMFQGSPVGSMLSLGLSPSPSLSTMSSMSSAGVLSITSSSSHNSGSSNATATNDSSSGGGSDEVFRSDKHAQASLLRMRGFYSGGLLCDVILVAGNRRQFPAHRLVLSAASDYFAAMFTSGLAEARQQEVALPHVDADSLETLLHYCYTGELSVRESSVESLLSTAHQLLLGEVVSVCCDFLASQLHPTNCIGIQLFADSQPVRHAITSKSTTDGRASQRTLLLNLDSDAESTYLPSALPEVANPQTRTHRLITAPLFYVLGSQPKDIKGKSLPKYPDEIYNDTILGCSSLQQAAQQYTAQHFSEVCGQQEFVQLRLPEVVQLLRSDDLNVASEETIMTAVSAWLEHDLPDRKPHSAAVLGLVRLPLLHPQYISDCVESSPLFRDDLKCQLLILEALKHHLRVPPPLDASDDQLVRARPRKSTVGALFLVGGMDASKSPVEVLSYNYRRNSWRVVGASGGSGGGRRLQCGGGVVGGRLHVVGGRDGLKTLNSVECWDHNTGHWSLLPNMATHRHGLGVGVVGGVVYSVGGHDGWSYLNTVERWDPGARVWTYVAPMATPRSSLGVAVLGGKLYAVGGRDGSSCLRSVECYDPHTNRWSPCAPLHRRRGGVGVGVLNGYLYAVGGHDAPASSPTVNRLDCVERYDPATDSWSLVSPGLEVGCDSTAVCQLGEQLVCVGGFTGTSYLTHVQAYDPSSNTWTQLAPIPNGRAGACTVVIR